MVNGVEVIDGSEEGGASRQGKTSLEAIQIIKKAGGSLKESFLDEG